MNLRTRILVLFALGSIYFAVVFFLHAQTVVDAPKLQVSFLDIGQGDAIYIKAPNGRDMLIDGGRDWNTLSPKLRAAMGAGNDELDVVLSTHPDADHAGGLPEAIKQENPEEFIEPGISTTTDTYTKMKDSVLAGSVPKIYARQGMQIILDQERNIMFTVLSPEKVGEDMETNFVSIVGRLSYGNHSFLLTADSPIEVEERLIKEGLATPTTILKLGHHGSKTSSSEDFLKAVQPDEAIISAGCHNSYGHPHKEVTSLLATLKIPSVGTCEHGTITYLTDGKTLQKKTEK